MWQVLYDLTHFRWGTPLMILMIGVGLYLTIRSGFFQFLGIPTWWKHTVGEVLSGSKSEDAKQEHEGELKPFQALSTVLAGTSRQRQHCGCCSRHCYRRSRRGFLDVAHCPWLRHDDQNGRSYAVRCIPLKRLPMVNISAAPCTT